ncbi:MAG: DEAD/DEAH box helicase [Elusimicrobiota bacterium]|jgi:ATP-dependent RNA helicase DeaD|nr:DEAD/DEAH box helicase [Elusimicrobiota bacterium]
MKTVEFNQLGLSNEILKAVADLGFEEATPIQTLAIPKMMTGVDIIGQAQTGTGKTAAFGIPILEKIDTKKKNVQALILCPTRELALQATEEFKLLAKHKRGVNIAAVYGGQPIQRQMSALSKGVHIVIGTPGRVIDHLERRSLKLDNVAILVLDEADEMLDMGFRDDIELILKNAPVKKQTVFFSATMPKPFLALTKRYQNNPQTIKIESEKLTVPLTEQYYFELRRPQKLEALTRCLDLYDPKLSIVFCNTKRQVDEAAHSLQTRGYAAAAIHGDMNQVQRERTMAKFRKGTVEILVATDVAARGIDVENVDIVFNYDVPQDNEDYVHRIGRTGRAGKTGVAFSFAAGKDIYKLREIQKYTRANIKRKNIPSLAEVENIKAIAILETVKSYINGDDMDKYERMIKTLVTDDITGLDVAAALLKMAFVEDNKDAQTIENVNSAVSSDGGAREKGMARLFLNIGKKDKVRAGDFVGAIVGETGLDANMVGDIKILDSYSFVEVPIDSAQTVIDALNSSNVRGKRVNVEVAKPK